MSRHQSLSVGVNGYQHSEVRLLFGVIDYFYRRPKDPEIKKKIIYATNALKASNKLPLDRDLIFATYLNQFEVRQNAEMNVEGT